MPATARSINTPSALSATRPCSFLNRPGTPESCSGILDQDQGMLIMTNLYGKTALVTGASRGIGRASALALARAGAQVLVHYGSGEKEATAVVAEIRKAGGKAEKISANMGAADGPHLLAERVRAIVG